MKGTLSIHQYFYNYGISEVLLDPNSDPSQVTLWRSLSVPIYHRPELLYLVSLDLGVANGLFLKIIRLFMKKIIYEKPHVLSVV